MGVVACDDIAWYYLLQHAAVTGKRRSCIPHGMMHISMLLVAPCICGHAPCVARVCLPLQAASMSGYFTLAASYIYTTLASLDVLLMPAVLPW